MSTPEFSPGGSRLEGSVDGLKASDPDLRAFASSGEVGIEPFQMAGPFLDKESVEAILGPDSEPHINRGEN